MSQEVGSKGEIVIVDDDPAVRETLSLRFSREGYEVTCFADGASFLAAAQARVPACILLDVYIPGRSGLDILKDLNAGDYPAPVFIISGQGDIPMAVDAIRHGALDFIEKPFSGTAVAARVRDAIAAWRFRMHEQPAADPVSLEFAGRKPLTRREGEVLAQLLTGASNKEVARQLGISPRTIEIHRAHIMGKLGAKNAADLVRIVMSERRGT
jgi:FixJ family two-component response regulator